jgi:hypothetical protein
MRKKILKFKLLVKKKIQLKIIKLKITVKCQKVAKI